MNPSPSSWTSTLTKAAWTLLLASVVAFIAWQLLRQLLAPLIIVLVLVGVFRLMVAEYRGGRM